MGRNKGKLIRNLLVGGSVLLSGCGDRILEPAEDQLGTGGAITMHYHSVMYYPDEIALRDGGYIVGIEKGSESKIFEEGEGLTFAQPHTQEKKVRDQQDAVHDGKIMFVSHMVKDYPPASEERNCTLHDAYYRASVTNTAISDCAEEKNRSEIYYKNAYAKSWNGMKGLQDSLSVDIGSGHYTHVVVVVMGWNTVQEEAIRNINSIVRGIKHAGGSAFKPLVIGVTWPSQWNSLWLDPLYKLTSFGTKAKDADEVGLTWLGVLLGDTIPQASIQAKATLPVIVIGHSFGARAATTAACEGPVIAEKPGTLPAKQLADLLISYQGAFLTKRLLDRSSDGQISDNCPGARRIALTSSKGDTAVTRAIWGVYAGSDKSFSRYCSTPSDQINCVHANAVGRMEPEPSADRRVTYVNSDKLIHYNAFNTGGGAHSDIYRDEQGELSWSLIKTLLSEKTSPLSALAKP